MLSSRRRTKNVALFIPLFAILFLASVPLFAAGPFGVNSDWDYVNLLKFESNGWYSPTGANLTYDENGWPTMDAEATVIDARHNMAWNGPDWVGTNPIVAGTYQLIFIGQATLTANTEGSGGIVVQNQEYFEPTNQTYAQIVLQPGYFLFQLTFSNTKRNPTDTPGTGFTDAFLVRPGYSPLSTQVFTNETFKSFHTGPFAVVRVPDGMNDYCQTSPDGLGNCFNGNKVVFAQWKDRVQVTDAFQGGLPNKNINGHMSHGQAWEYCIEFANATNEDLWINVPINASDNYIYELASLLKNGNQYTPGLNPNLHIYVEYANEIWNFGASQGNYVINSALATEENGFNSNNPNFYYYNLPEQDVLHTIKIAKIFAEVWGQEAINNQIRPVVMWTNFNGGFEASFSRVLEYVEGRIKEPVSTYLYGVGENAYYNPSYTITAGAGGNNYHVNYPNADSVDNLFNALWTGSDLLRQDFIGWNAVATYYGLHEVAYEGGPTLLDGPGASAARDPRIAASEVHHFLDNWYASGGTVMNYTSMRSGIGAGTTGDWFLIENFGQTNTPRLNGALQVMKAPQPAFTDGFVLPWTAGQNVQIDPSQRVPDWQSSYATPGSGLDEYKHSYDQFFDEALYLLRPVAGGAYSISLFAYADSAKIQEQIKVDDQLLATVPLPVGPGAAGWTAPVQVNLTPGFHTLLLTPITNDTNPGVHFPAGSGAIQIASVSASGTAVVPSAPTYVTTTPSSSAVTLLWAPQTTATSYNVKRSTHSGGPYTTVGSTANNTYTDSVANGTAYYYVVTALNSAGESAVSPQSPGEATPAEAPSAPAGLTAQAAAGDSPPWLQVGGEAQLSWSHVKDALAYNIYLSSTSGGESLGNPEVTVLGTKFLDYGEPYTQDSGPNPPGNTYYYTVTAINSYGESPFSAEVSVTPNETIPPAPSGVTAQARTGSVYLKWATVFGETPSLNPQYNVKRSTTPGGPYATISSIATANFTDIATVSGTTYYYVVSATKSIGEGPNSAEVSATAK